MLDDLIKRLADGKFHSGEAIAVDLGLTRAAVWKQVSKLKQMGLTVDSVRGRGYRIRQRLDLLNLEKIQTTMSGSAQSLIKSIKVHTIIDSSSDYLKQLLQYPERRMDLAAEQYFCDDSAPGYVCLAEYQTQGRGRRGRDWLAPFGSSLCFSLLWRFDLSSVAINGLSLALGVALIRALRDYGAKDVGLKWPNDIYWQQKKLGGILFEVFAEQGGDGYIIAGVGLNILMPAQMAQKIDQPWIDLTQVLLGKPICRNTLAAKLLEYSSLAMQEFSNGGFDSFSEHWQEFDICRNQSVSLQMGENKITGIARGVDSQGQLILDTAQGRKIYASGEVSLRFE